ncbi:hypothetical protein FCM35_KLT07043 [Carex littledalei]|uniref:Uncharacterized protein n=1 Tax=Carex littledalei TaxID=544730 RepID=A0A833V889_9POAL|nr:hypothetical protein FCM35_KLT07043 [Carex littledalei]
MKLGFARVEHCHLWRFSPLTQPQEVVPTINRRLIDSSIKTSAIETTRKLESSEKQKEE